MFEHFSDFLEFGPFGSGWGSKILKRPFEHFQPKLGVFLVLTLSHAELSLIFHPKRLKNKDVDI